MPRTNRSRTIPVIVLAAGLGLALSACRGSSNPGATGTAAGSPGTAASSGAPSPTESPLPTEKPVAAESNPPGDIPDNTQFVPYRSAKGHFEVKVPEGWSRTTGNGSVSFTDKLNTVAVDWSADPSAPTVSSVKHDQVPKLQASERAFVLGKVQNCAPSCTIPYSTAPIHVTLPAGNSVVLTYQVNSAPNSVTGKQYRLEVIRFDFFHAGEEADLILSGPVGSDNVDPWTLVAQSFRWI